MQHWDTTYLELMAILAIRDVIIEGDNGNYEEDQMATRGKL